MAKPVVSPIQSVIGYLQWQAFAVQFTASNDPTSWDCTPIAPGLFFDDETGRIDGAATVPGVYKFYITATNADGTSDPVEFVMGIEASGFIAPANVVDLVIETTTRRVYMAATGIDAGNANANANSGGEDADGKLTPLFYTKAGDDLIMNVRFTKGGVTFVPDLTALKFILKEFEPEGKLVSGDTFTRIGAGDMQSFLMHVKVESPALRAALTNYEDDEATQFPALGEFEWQENNSTDPQVGPDVIRMSSRTFAVLLPRDLIPNT